MIVNYRTIPIAGRQCGELTAHLDHLGVGFARALARRIERD